jgi:hypothetical protein
MLNAWTVFYAENKTSNSAVFFEVNGTSDSQQVIFLPGYNFSPNDDGLAGHVFGTKV